MENKHLAPMDEDGVEEGGDREIDVLNNDDMITPVQSGLEILWKGHA